MEGHWKKVKLLKRKYEAKEEIPGGGGEGSNQKTFHGGYGYFLELLITKMYGTYPYLKGWQHSMNHIWCVKLQTFHYWLKESYSEKANKYNEIQLREEWIFQCSDWLIFPFQWTCTCIYLINQARGPCWDRAQRGLYRKLRPRGKSRYSPSRVPSKLGL